MLDQEADMYQQGGSLGKILNEMLVDYSYSSSMSICISKSIWYRQIILSSI